VWVNALD